MTDHAARRWKRLGGRGLLLLALAAALAMPLLQAQGQAAAQERIIGGTPVKAGEMPFVGMVWYKDGMLLPFCVGTLIAPARVLTAASCTYDFFTGEYGPDNLAVSFMTAGGGVFDQRRIRVTGVTRHPKYDPERCEPRFGCANDAAVLELVDSPAGIKPVPIVKAGDRDHERQGARLTMAGWSGDTVSAPAPWMLTAAAAPVVEPELCKHRYGGLSGLEPGFRPRVVPRAIICTYTYTSAPSSLELGGPSLVRVEGAWLQVGLISATGFDSAAKWPVVHTPLGDPETNRWLQRAAGKGGR